MVMVNCLVVWKMATLHCVFKRNLLSNIRLNYRLLSDSKVQTCKKGIIVGVYAEEKKDQLVLTPAAEFYNGATGGKLLSNLEKLQPDLKKGSCRTFYGLTADHLATCVVCLGKKNEGIDELEEVNQKKENIRIAAATGANALQGIGINDIEIENLEDAEAAAEGAFLQLWQYQELKSEDKQKKIPNIRYYSAGKEKENSAWNKGLIYAKSQNLARKLADTPANLLTPTIFACQAEEILGKKPNVEVFVRNKAWAEEQKMNAFLSVAQGSSQPPVFLEIHYNGKNDSSNPIVFVGKGVTFDSGGISIKPAANMDEMRADMGGAACVFGTINAIAELRLPVNLIGLIPLTENMPGSSATKPGDVVRAMNGKSIKIDNTDAEGRLILADALCYAQKFNPRFILDIATLTGAMRIALGNGATGVFSNSTKLWSQLQSAGVHTGDRMWRFPLWNVYSKRVTDFYMADVNNVGKGKGGGSCTAAAFLREFVSKGDWLHLDIAGVMGPSDDIPYLSKGMTGRPTRTLIHFLHNFC